MPQAHFFAPITKIDVEKREVWGTLAEEAVDKVKEIFDYNGSKPYFQKWNESFQALTSNLDQPSFGNVREMHGKAAAGKFISMSYDDDTQKVHVGAKVVDNQAWEKCLEGVYTGFSIGGDYVKRYDDPTIKGAKRYVANPTEGSLVDNPCMYGATFQIVKSATDTQLAKFVGQSGLEKMISDAVDARLKKSEKTKRVDNTDLHSSAFLIVGDESNPETWHLPVHFPTEEQTVNHIHAAMGRVNQVEGVSHQVKSGAARRLASLASKHGIEVKEFNQKFLSTEFPRALKKSMYDVGNLAQIMQSLAYMENSLIWEKEIEEDDSKVPDGLHAAMESLGQIFLQLAEEELSELLREKEAEKSAKNTLTKGGGPNMPPTNTGVEKTPEELQKSLSDATDALKKRDDLLVKAVDHLKNLSGHVDKMRATHDKMGEHVDALAAHVDKATNPMHKDVAAVKDHHDKMGDHLDKCEGSIEDLESATVAEVDKDDNQKYAPARLIKRMERSFEKKLASQQATHEQTLGKFVDAMERLAKGPAPTVAAAAPVRTFIAPEKNADAAGVGGVVLAKGAPAPGTTPASEVAAVDAYGMPNPEYVEKAQARGDDFVKAAKLTKLQAGNPFPSEFGSGVINK